MSLNRSPRLPCLHLLWIDMPDDAGPRELAEFQELLAAPLTTIVLTLLGVPLSRMSPQQGRHSRIILSIVV